MEHQLTFADSEFSSKRRQTRKEIFLSRMDALLPWSMLLALIAYSGAIRTPIPALPGQSFRDKPDTDSAINQPF